MNLLPHQEAFVRENPRKSILAWGTRVGKTYAMCLWMQNYPKVRFVLVCPKRIKKQWQNELKKTKTLNAVVLTKEEVKKADLSSFAGFVADEAHWLASGLYRPHKTSQLTKVVYDFIRRNPEMPVLLATATPISSSPANLHTLMALSGSYYDPKKYRDYFYQLVRRPYVPQPFWEPKKNWRELLQPLALKHCRILRLSDVATISEDTHTMYPVRLAAETLQKIESVVEDTPQREWYAKHKLAQYEEKLEAIRELAADEPKVIVVAKYVDQLEYYRTQLEKDREVVVLSGQVKNQSEAIERSQKMTEGYFLLQADCGEGFRGDSFSLCIFASLSWKYTSFEQTLGRMRHLNKRSGNAYYYLMADEKDKDVYERIKAGKDFSLTES